MEKIPIWEKLNLTIEEAAQYSGIGVNKLREIAKRDNCSFALKRGSHILIKRKEFELWNSESKIIS